jgi:hypothetical protein
MERFSRQIEDVLGQFGLPLEAVIVLPFILMLICALWDVPKSAQRRLVATPDMRLRNYKQDRSGSASVLLAVGGGLVFGAGGCAAATGLLDMSVLLELARSALP